MRAVLRLCGETLLPAICVVGIAYNVLVMLNAPEGIRMNKLLKEELAAERATLATLKAERDHLSDRADRLMSASLDKDLLDERVRSVLGLVRPGELMVRMEDLDRIAELNAIPEEEAPLQKDPILLAMLDL